MIYKALFISNSLFSFISLVSSAWALHIENESIDTDMTGCHILPLVRYRHKASGSSSKLGLPLVDCLKLFHFQVIWSQAPYK